MENLPSPTIWALPFFVITIIAEWLWSRRNARIKYETKDAFTSMAMGTGSIIAGLITGSTVFALSVWVYNNRLWDFNLSWNNAFWLLPLMFLLDDLFYYIFHRSAHRIRWFWAAHVNHHSSEHYNLTTALRQTWTGFIAFRFIFRLPLFFVGFPPALIFFMAGINLVYQYWIHTESIGKLPRWFEAIMNTPSHHRVHHATNAQYLDRNYAGVFIIWDKMFGTFEAENDDEKIQYGIIKNVKTYNLLWVSFHEWIGIAQDVCNAPTWRDKINYCIREPGWSHDGSRETSSSLKKQYYDRMKSERGDSYDG